MRGGGSGQVAREGPQAGGVMGEQASFSFLRDGREAQNKRSALCGCCGLFIVREGGRIWAVCFRYEANIPARVNNARFDEVTRARKGGGGPLLYSSSMGQILIKLAIAKAAIEYRVLFVKLAIMVQNPPCL